MRIAELLSKVGFDVDAKPLDAVSKRLEDIKGRLAFLGAAEVLRGIAALTQGMGTFAGDLLHAAETAGVSTSALQGLQYAAAQAGATAQDMSGALGTLTKSLYDVRSGNEGAIESFKQVGFSADQVKGFRSSSEALSAIADRLAGMQDPIARQALANKLLGGSANALIPLLSKGSAGIASASAEAKEFGAVVGGQNLEALHEAEAALSALWQTTKAFAATVASYFAPGIAAAAKAVMHWVGANRELLATSVKKWAENIMYAFGFLYGIVEGLIQLYLDWAAAHPQLASAAQTLVVALAALSLGALAAGKVVSFLSSLFGALQLAISPIAAVARGAFAALGGMAALAVRGLVAVLFQMAVMTETAFPALSAALVSFAGVLEATPIGWIITAVAALVLGLEAAYTMLFKGGNFKDTWLGQMWDGIKGAGSWVLDKLGMGDQNGQAQAKVPFRPGMAPGQEPANIPPDLLQPSHEGVISALMAGHLPGGVTPPPGSAGDFTSTINAPVTINVPPGTPPASVADAVKDGIKEHMDRVSRETRRSLRSAQAY